MSEIINAYTLGDFGEVDRLAVNASLLETVDAGFLLCCKVLKAQPGAARVTNIHGQTPLMLAIMKNDLRLCRVLIPHSDLNAVDSLGWTPLMFAAASGFVEICMELVVATQVVTTHTAASQIAATQVVTASDRSSSLLAQEFSGKTALILAAMNGYDDVCGVLLSQGLTSTLLTKMRDIDGRTALMHAAMRNHTKVCRLLSNTRHLEDHEGETASSLAELSGYYQLSEMLR